MVEDRYRAALCAGDVVCMVNLSVVAERKSSAVSMYRQD